MIRIMKKSYITPRTEAIQLLSENVIMAASGAHQTNWSVSHTGATAI